MADLSLRDSPADVIPADRLSVRSGVGRAVQVTQGRKIAIVYALVDPISGHPRYVGQTVRDPKRRLSQHICACKRKTVPPVNAWLRGLVLSGMRPDIWVMDEHKTHSSADEAEIFWIQILRSWGFKLLNHADGGAGRRGWNHTDEQKAAFKVMRSGLKPTWLHVPEVRKRVAKSLIERAAVIGGHRLGIKHTEEARIKMRVGRAKNPPKITDAGRARITAGSKRRWDAPGYRAQWAAKMSKPDSRAAKRAEKKALQLSFMLEITP